ncbi:MFS transporter [Rubrivivax gelatinosus]|uniref:DHA1 family bicyclomycin/chloramphenicol resistance-like MFS transporter n=1 Tax=Rubrivivax gelatinosus TaxID=28068 RepID=A0A4R2LXR6_RUBGE|nr:MFS transporter [Rubrivivax gelatinosus]MBK1689857.1 Bcr/CflA family drug resistance efflux transporter [Rubrivivax gelatinosus]TCO97134.1 DHA1 family bicyclomycin/chloramphenicol resistance-like MFS transporter [Rubrivivax gelatinosus]
MARGELAAARPASAGLTAGLAAAALALLLALQPVSTDIMVPALPVLSRALGVPVSSAQATMGAMMLGFGLAQLVWGPLADRAGRRPVLLGALALFVAACAGGALAGDIGTLVAWRALQGAAMAAAVVLARAIVRDLYEPHEGAQVMARAQSGLGAIAIVSPALGGLAVGVGGWRAAPALMAVIGAATLAFIALRLPETRPPQRVSGAPALAAWRAVLRHPSFVAWTLLNACSYAGLFVILSGSSFVYMNRFGLSAGAAGLTIASGSLAFLGGTLACRHWIVRRGMEAAAVRGGFFTLAGGLGTAAAALAGAQTVWPFLVAQWLFSFGHGIHQPCGQAGAVGPFPQQAGVASALSGFVLALGCFAVGAWLGAVQGTDVRPYALTLAFWAAATAAVAWTLVRRLQVSSSDA